MKIEAKHFFIVDGAIIDELPNSSASVVVTGFKERCKTLWNLYNDFRTAARELGYSP
jgi:hypothetical protein